MRLIVAGEAPVSPARVNTPERPTLRVGLVQHRWREDPAELSTALHDAIGEAARQGAKVVFLPEITLLRYPADTRATGRPGDTAEELESGPSYALAARAAKEHGVHVHISVYRQAPSESDGLGLNTSILVAPDGTVVGATDKTHIPITAGYYEDTYFRPGPAETAYPLHVVDGLDDLRLGMPTCWDEWFPEVARSYSLQGAEVLVYPTAIGSEPDHPDFDTAPLWRQVIVGHAISNGLFMVVPNRVGDEGVVTFYGSSFIADPYGRVLVEAPRDEEAVLVADLDLAQRTDWLDLFPFLTTRRPDTYAGLTVPVDHDHPHGA